MGYYLPDGYGQIIHKIVLSGDPEPMYATIGFVADSVGEDPAVIAAGVHTAWKTLVSSKFQTNYSTPSTEVRYKSSAGPDLLVAEAVSTQAGGGAGATLPQNCAYMVRKNTGLGGAKNKGRMYFPGCVESVVNTLGQVDSAEITSWNSALATYKTSVEAATGVLQLMLLHNITVENPVPFPTQITSLTLDAVIATQRRRLRR